MGNVYLFCHLNFFFILLFNHLFLKAYKVVSSSEDSLYSLAGFPKAGGGPGSTECSSATLF